jgi:hypothetical protein
MGWNPMSFPQEDARRHAPRKDYPHGTSISVYDAVTNTQTSCGRPCLIKSSSKKRQQPSTHGSSTFKLVLSHVQRHRRGHSYTHQHLRLYSKHTIASEVVHHRQGGARCVDDGVREDRHSKSRISKISF